MSLSRGPVRIVLLRSGGYDYADLPLHDPIHLVGGNNAGKTTVIAALQFLYIDDVRQMHFSHDWSKTRHHYFPHNGSLVLFECMTPTGLQVLGFRGLGPVQGHEYERFVYRGAFDRSDYVDGQRIRPWEEVTRDLVGRDLVFLEPRHLRASLTGSGEAKGSPLGLVPLRRSGSYDSFRFLFQNLLRLTKIDQNQLKQLFIDISRPRLRVVEIDLRHDYAELFAQVEQQATGVRALRRVEPAIAALVEAFARRQDLRARLLAQWAAIVAALEAERVHTTQATEALDLEREQVDGQLGQIAEHEKAVRAEASSASETRGGLLTRIEDWEALKARVQGFAPELEAAARVQMEERRDDLGGRISQASRADRRQVEKRLAETTRAIERDERLVERFSDAVATWLRTRSGLEEAEIDDIFRVLNPALLGEVIGDGRVVVRDADALIAFLRAMRDRFGPSGFEAAGAWLPREALATTAPLAGYQDVASIRDRLTSARELQAELSQALRDIEQREQLIEERKQVEEALRRAEARLRDWEAWGAAAPQLDEAKDQAERLSAAITAHGVDLDRIGTRRIELTREKDGLESRGRALRENLARLVSDVQRLQPPSPSWGATPAEWPHPDALPDLVRSYRKDHASHGEVVEQVHTHFADVESKTGSKYVGADEAETIARLKDELAALDEREQAVQQLWTSLVDSMRSAFKGLVEGVDTIRAEVSRLTRALGQRQISNLERVEIELFKQRDLLQRLTAVIEAEASPLFAGPDGRSRAADQIAHWLQDRPGIDLAELFDLRFKIVDRTGQAKSFDSLAQIESQGTSTTIKVLVHLELLKTMLSDEAVAVPFFLDEVATLDESNLRGLIDHARAMGFVPVVASPEPRDCVDTLYFLRPGRGGTILDETSRVVVRREASSGA